MSTVDHSEPPSTITVENPAWLEWRERAAIRRGLGVDSRGAAQAAALLDCLPEAVRAERLRRGLTQQEVADELGVYRSDLAAWERRLTTPSLNSATNLLRWLAS